MVQRICPVCDREMKSAHYCRNCKSWVKNPRVREVSYHLNERHPRNETECSYHNVESRPSPDRVWKPIELPALNDRKQAGAETGKNKRPHSSGWAVAGIFAVAFFASAAVTFSGQLLDTIPESMEPGLKYDIDMEEDELYQELDEDAVKKRGENCNSRGHFSVLGTEMEQPVLDILRDAGLEIVRQDTHSYNEVYQDGETWYTTWTTIEVKGEGEDSYQYVELDFDTGTGKLHEISLSLENPGKLSVVTCAILEALAEKGELPADADCFVQIPEELPAALAAGRGFHLFEGLVAIEGISYEQSYSVYISHNIGSEL